MRYNSDYIVTACTIILNQKILYAWIHICISDSKRALNTTVPSGTE